MKKPFCVASMAVCAVASITAGWILAGWPGTSQKPVVDDAGPAHERGRHAVRSNEASKGLPLLVSDSLREIRAFETPVEQLRATHALVDRLSVADLKTWLDHCWFDAGDGYPTELFKQLALARWADVDPEGQALWVINHGGGDSALHTWAETDPNRVMAFFKSHPHPDQELRLLRVMASSHPARTMARLEEMLRSNANRGSSTAEHLNVRSVMFAIGSKDAALLEDSLDRIPATWRTAAEAVLVERRLLEDFGGELTKLHDHPNGFEILRTLESTALRNQILDHLRDLPDGWKSGLAEYSERFIVPDTAENWLRADLSGCGFSADQIQAIHTYALSQMAVGAPQVAISRLADLNLPNDLRTNTLSNIFYRIFECEANRSESNAETMIGMLPAGDDQRVARSRLEDARYHAKEQSATFRRPNPPAWLEEVAALDPGKSDALVRSVDNWPSERVTELAEGLRNLPDAQRAKVAAAVVRNHDGTTQSNEPIIQGESIHYLVEHPPGDGLRDRFGDAIDLTYLASAHAVSWVNRDPEAASRWVATLPEGEARQWAQTNLVHEWAKNDPDSARRWAEQLPRLERDRVLRAVPGGK